MGDSDLGLYFLIASCLIMASAILAFIIACRSRRRSVRAGVGLSLLALAIACAIPSFVVASIVAAMGIFALVLASRTPHTYAIK